jgi:dephospho-CoA kinase
MTNTDSRGEHSTRPYLLGVTGNIACGKTTVMQRLRELGAETLDADAIYHRLIEPGKSLWQSLRDAFGEGIIASDGTINRRALGQIVFSDPAKLTELDRLTHPAVRIATRQQIDASTRAVVAVDAVKLIESGSAKVYDQVWLVVCDPEVQIERLMARNGLSCADAVLRVKAQPPVGEKRRLVDVVIDNSGAIEATHREVDRLWSNLPPNRS